MCAQSDSSNNNKSVVTIERARSTETKKDAETGRDIIIFSGEVKLNIVKDKTVINITADTVNYDRGRDMLYASGEVIMQEVVTGSSQKTLTGHALIMNTTTLEGVFDDMKLTETQTATVNLPSGSVMIISSDVLARDDTGTVVFKDSYLTFCDDEDPHWKIRASRVWLLPGNEFALANGLLYIGHIPIAYIPFFYYPKDELIFNPSFGYRPRAGYFTQTTTYLIGRKSLQTITNDNDSLFNFVRPSQLMEQRREGLFLRNLNTPASNVSPDYLKFMGDIYSNLGVMTGFEGAFKPQNNFITDFGFSTLFGFSRNLYFLEKNALYSPKNSVGKSEWNKSTVFSIKLPFRFFTDIHFEGETDELKLSLKMPFYSDPFFKADFMDRQENMDWLNYITRTGTTTEEELEKIKDYTLESYSWKLQGSYTPDLGDVTPFFDFKVTSVYSELDWATKNDPAATTATVSPDRKFFYPSKIVPLNANVSISGTLFKYPPEGKKITSSVPGAVPGLEMPDDWAVPEVSTEKSAADTSDQIFPILPMPVLDKKNIGGFEYSLTYAYNPAFASLYSYSPDAWKTASDTAWKEYMSSFYSISGAASIKSSASWKNSFISLINSLIFNPVYQRHPEISSVYYTTESAREQVLLSDYMARKLDLTSKNSLELKPFVLTDMFADSSLSWNSEIRLFRTKFSGSVKAPVWEYLPPKWDDESIIDHNITAKISIKEDLFAQELTVKRTLPPLLPSYKATLGLEFPYFKTKMETGYAVKSKTDDSWYMLPFTEESFVSAFNDKFTMAQSYKYITKKKQHEYFNVSASYEGFSLSYSNLFTTGYTYDMLSGWKADGELKFRPYQAALKYNTPEKKYYYWWKNRIAFAPSLSMSLVADFIRPPNSYLIFSPSFSFKIHEFLDITFTSEHNNEVIFRYVQGFVNYNPQIPGETNLWTDLMDSFNFADSAKRNSSGFKLKKLSMEINHNLHDWNVNSKVKIEPRLLTENGRTRYDYSPYISLSVVWKPMSAMKAEIVDEYGKVELNP